MIFALMRPLPEEPSFFMSWSITGMMVSGNFAGLDCVSRDIAPVWREDVRQSADARFAIVAQRDRDATQAETDRCAMTCGPFRTA